MIRHKLAKVFKHISKVAKILANQVTLHAIRKVSFHASELISSDIESTFPEFVVLSEAKTIETRLRVVNIQCDQMARLFVQYFAIYI